MLSSSMNVWSRQFLEAAVFGVSKEFTRESEEFIRLSRLCRWTPIESNLRRSLQWNDRSCRNRHHRFRSRSYRLKPFEVFFTVHDPTQLNRQGNDIGTQYRSCIMPTSHEQKETALASIESFSLVFDKPIVTTIEEAKHLTIAEAYHHDYYARNPTQGYCAMVVVPEAL